MKGTHGNCYLTQLVKILMCKNVCHSGFKTSENSEVKRFRRIEPRTDETRQIDTPVVDSVLCHSCGFS